jgi:hypothetical protein
MPPVAASGNTKLAEALAELLAEMGIEARER